LRTLCRLDESFVTRLHVLVPGGSKVEVEDVLRISWNTWSKIRARESIRYSLAVRLVARVLDIQGDCSDPEEHLILTSGKSASAAGSRRRDSKSVPGKLRVPNAVQIKAHAL
jgi:hypothetical protein